MGSPRCTDSFWGGIFTWHRSSRQYLTKCIILPDFVTGHFRARVVKVQQPLEGALPKCTVLLLFQWLCHGEIDWNFLRMSSHTLHCSMPKMAPTGPFLDIPQAKNVTFTHKSVIVVEQQVCKLSSSASDRWTEPLLLPLLMPRVCFS